MILLTKGQPLFDNPSMVVYDTTGYYEDGSSVVCASALTPEEPLARYEAKFIAYGGMVYTITDPDQLMAEVLKIDPQSLFGKTNEQAVVDELVEKIETIESPELPTETIETPTTIEETPEPVEPLTTSEPTPEPESETTPVPQQVTPTPGPNPAPAVEPAIETPTPVETTAPTETTTTTTDTL